MLTATMILTGCWMMAIGTCGDLMLDCHGVGLAGLDRAVLRGLFRMHRILGALAILWAVW